jgi:hypothetical protein
MIVKIGDREYSSEREPLMIVLDDVEKQHINDMLSECHKYCSAPESMPEAEIRAFMTLDEDKPAEERHVNTRNALHLRDFFERLGAKLPDIADRRLGTQLVAIVNLVTGQISLDVDTSVKMTSESYLVSDELSRQATDMALDQLTQELVKIKELT